MAGSYCSQTTEAAKLKQMKAFVFHHFIFELVDQCDLYAKVPRDEFWYLWYKTHCVLLSVRWTLIWTQRPTRQIKAVKS